MIVLDLASKKRLSSLLSDDGYKGLPEKTHTIG
jgi:hypothetical protein